MYGKFVHLQQV